MLVFLHVQDKYELHAITIEYSFFHFFDPFDLVYFHFSVYIFPLCLNNVKLRCLSQVLPNKLHLCNGRWIQPWLRLHQLRSHWLGAVDGLSASDDGLLGKPLQQGKHSWTSDEPSRAITKSGATLTLLKSLRNIKRLPCSHSLMQTLERVWENSKVFV